MEKRTMIKSFNEGMLAIQSDYYRDVDATKTCDIPKRTTIGEYIMVMHLADGLKIRAKTGSVNHSTAKDLAYDGILFVEENFGPVIFWNWEGEETVIRTVQSAFPIKETTRGGILGKISNFINADDVTEIERIRRRNRRKEKFDAIKAKIDTFFDLEDEYEYEEVDVSAKPKTLKEKLIHFLYEEVDTTEK